MIERVPYERIDKSAYDRCVKGSKHFRITATSGYLDAVAQNWDVLVHKDYEVVMPLPKRTKFGFNYIYTPVFVQQMGVFSPEEVSPALQKAFLNKLTSGFVLVDYALHGGSAQTKGAIERLNFTLDLSAGLKAIFEGFNSNRKRIARGRFEDLEIEKSGDPIYFQKQLDRKDLGFVPDGPTRMVLKRLVEKQPDVVRTWSVVHEGEWVGGLIWLLDHKRLTYLLPVASEKGKALDVPTFIILNLIREYEGTHMMLDFEGSMIPGVARFYESFGAHKEIYYFLKTRFYGVV